MSGIEKTVLNRAFEGIDRADPAGAEPADEVRDRILAAAREQFQLAGLRRSSIEDVARRAGVSRITIYRRFPNKDALIETVLVDLLRQNFVLFRAAVRQAPTAAERVVEGFALALHASRQDPLIGGLMTHEPQLLVPFLTIEGGPLLGVVREFVAGQLRREQESGAIPATVDVRVVAELLTRITTSFFLTPESVVDLDDPEQLRTLARRYLAPLVEAAPG